jgi:hypothetical protein
MKGDISSAKGAAEDKKFQLDMAQRQYESQKNKAEAAKKFAETKDVAYLEGKSSAANKISDQKSKAEKAKGSVEQRQREYSQAQALVKSLIEKIEKQAKEGVK